MQDPGCPHDLVAAPLRLGLLWCAGAAPPLPYLSSEVHFIVFFHFAGGQLACFFPQVLSCVLDLDFHSFCVAYALSCRSWSCLCGALIRPGPPRASCGLDDARPARQVQNLRSEEVACVAPLDPAQAPPGTCLAA